jgi:hypothetical protein
VLNEKGYITRENIKDRREEGDRGMDRFAFASLSLAGFNVCCVVLFHSNRLLGWLVSQQQCYTAHYLILYN